MRVLPVRRLASTTLCAALLVGIAGPAAVAADSARERTHAGSHPAVPGTDALLAQVRSLRNADPVLNPVVDLLDQSLQKGRLTPDEARRLGDAAKAAIAKAAAAAPTTPASPTTPAAPTAPASPATPATPTAPATPTDPAMSNTAASPSMSASQSMSASPSRPAAPSLPPDPSVGAPTVPAAAAAPLLTTFAKSDVKAGQARDLTGDLQNAIDALLQAVTSNVDALLVTVTGAVSALVDLITSTIGGLPLPQPVPLPSLPAEPAPPTG
ncbi:hypothetical protein [Streptomyces sp. PTD9-10]|uniref:hypothetical protein n=1 Tax=Streptomyces sp. PTD9-10 TaxID=3120151 RepID=UPI0030095D98